MEDSKHVCILLGTVCQAIRGVPSMMVKVVKQVQRTGLSVQYPDSVQV